MPTDSSLRSYPVPYDRFEAYTKLFSTYCNDYESVSGYYAGNFRDPDVWRQAAERASSHQRDRATVADTLLEQNEAWDTLDGSSRENIELLRDPESVAVVTGQQAGIFTGPLYTVYKTITALQLAERFAEETGRPVVPVFWVEGEDHDFDEVAGINLLRRNETEAVRYEPQGAQNGANQGAVGRLVLTDAITEVIEQIDEILPPTEFKPAVMRSVRDAYKPGAALEDAFVRFHHSLFPESGLVYFNPDEARLKALAAPLFKKELDSHQDVFRRLEEVSTRLEEDGYHAQVRPHPTNLFLFTDDGRTALDTTDGALALRGDNASVSVGELEDLLASKPEAFSPNVALRPLMQDALLPTAAYVAGPGEVAYFAQFRPLYEWAGVPMPVVYPRASVTLVERKVKKVLDRFEMEVSEFQDDIERIFQRRVVDELEVDEVFEEAQRKLHEAVNTVKPAIGQVDKSLAASAEAARAALSGELEALKGRVVRAEKRNRDEVRAQLAKAQSNLFPADRPQERVINVLYYLNKYSPELLRRLREELSLETAFHQIVEL